MIVISTSPDHRSPAIWLSRNMSWYPHFCVRLYSNSFPNGQSLSPSGAMICASLRFAQVAVGKAREIFIDSASELINDTVSDFPEIYFARITLVPVPSNMG